MSVGSDRSTRGRFAAHVLDWLYAAGIEVAHLVRPRRWDELTSGTRAPVLVLPGVYEPWEFMRPIARRAHALGHPVHVVPGFGYNRGSIPEMAERAQRHLDRNDLTGVVIIGHSKGGLIGKHMMVTDDTCSRIDRLIAVNTPFGGSSYARFALRRTLREFAPTGTVLAGLAARLDTNARIVSIYSAEDPVIPDGSELAGAVNIELPVIGHFRLLSSDLLASTIEGLLADRTTGCSAQSGDSEHDHVDDRRRDDEPEQQP